MFHLLLESWVASMCVRAPGAFAAVLTVQGTQRATAKDANLTRICLAASPVKYEQLGRPALLLDIS